VHGSWKLLGNLLHELLKDGRGDNDGNS
jgi:hypothetical protein